MTFGDPRLPARIWDRIERRGGCWLWTGPRDREGYGRGKDWKQRKRHVHRFVYEWVHGPLLPGLHLDHRCKERACCNPAHLEPVTPQENNRRSPTASTLNKAKTHCPQGHEYSEANTYIFRGHRQCRVCNREWGKRYRERRRTTVHPAGRGGSR